METSPFIIPGNRTAKFSFRRWFAFVFLIPIVLCPHAHAAAGLDAGFDPNVGGLYVHALAVQPDGKILIGGNFTQVAGQDRYFFARLDTNGVPEATNTFNLGSGTSFEVSGLAVQADGKIVLGGNFTSVNNQPHYNIARLDTNGVVEGTNTFNPDGGTSGQVFSVVLQPDGRIVIAGAFVGFILGFNPADHWRIARLNTNGTVESGFNPGLLNWDGAANSAALQADGKIVVGGDFTTAYNQPRNRIFRANADGTLEGTGTFNPGTGPDNTVYAVAVQADGKLLIGGEFSQVNNNTNCSHLARLNADGSVDSSFLPGTAADGAVRSIAVQADGKIIIGGNFTNFNGLARYGIARLATNGALESTATFNAAATNEFVTGAAVHSVALQTDGKILVGGTFNMINGQTRNKLARLTNDVATQSLTVPLFSRAQWLRGGSSPEVAYVTFEVSTNAGTNWISLGTGSRISGGWEITGLNLYGIGQIRARGWTAGGTFNGSSSMMEAVAAFSFFPEIAVQQPAGTNLVDGATTNNLGNVRVGFSSVPRTFTVTNSGTAMLTLGAFTIDGAHATNFSKSAPGTTNVAPNSSTTFTVTFNPSAPGNRSAALHFANNDTDENPFDIALAGYGVSTNANLTNLVLSAAAFAPAFAAATTNYSATVPRTTTTTTVTPTTADTNATVTVNGNALASGNASAPISLNLGTNIITIVVTAEDAITIKTYTISVNRLRSTNADLSGLTISTGAFTPAFDPTNLNYATAVAGTTSNLTVTPTIADTNASVTVNGNAVASGNASAAIPLSGGTNVIAIAVTAEDGTTIKTYTISVFRPISNNASLTNLTLSTGAFAPSFAAATTNYSAIFPRSTTNVTVTPTVADTNATITVNGNAVASGNASANISLSLGTNVITVAVTAEDATTIRTYRISVFRSFNTNADLSNLTLSTGAFAPAFAATTTNYSATVSNTTTTATVTPTVADTNATVTVNGNAVTSGNASASIALSLGTNVITIAVTAEDATTIRTYRISVIRPFKTNADLSNLTSSIGAFTPSFAAATTNYSASVTNTTTTATVTPTVADTNATVTVNGNAVVSGTASASISLNVGANVITTMVTAQDSVTTKTYKLTVTRAAAPGATTPGNVDTSFAASSTGLYIRCTAVQPDGKIVIGGSITNVNGQTRNYIARLNADGTLESTNTFNPGSGPNNQVLGITVQPDGKLVISGYFTNVNGQARSYIARLNADGSLEPTNTFNASANAVPYGVLLQTNGKLVLYGLFTTVDGQSRNRIARVNADGSLESTNTFNVGTGANSEVDGASLQADGKILVGGNFTTFNGQTRNRIVRLNSDGSVEGTNTFNIGSGVGGGRCWSLVQQPDGKILVAGEYTTFNGQPRGHIARLNADGTMEGTNTFNTGLGVQGGEVTSLALQTDGKILLGGFFTNINSQPRGRVARLNADGTVEGTNFFNIGTGAENGFYSVLGIALQADGKILVAGQFTIFNGQSHSHLVRLLNDPASGSLTNTSAARVEWLRGGAAPEVGRVTFEMSTNGGGNYSLLGSGSRISGGWELTGLNLPSTNLTLRARGRTSGGDGNFTAGLVETVKAAPLLEQWQAAYGGNSGELLTSIQPAGDGGYILGGYSYSGVAGNKTSPGHGDADFWLVKVDGNGIKQWDKDFGGSAEDVMTTVQPTSDGGYILGGWSWSGADGNKTSASFGDRDYWLVKVDSSGNKQWEKVFGGTGADVLYSVQPTADGGYLLAGISDSPVSGNKTNAGFGDYDIWLVKVDGSGNKQWEKVFGGTGGDYVRSLQPASDGGWILGGYSFSGVSGNKTTPNRGDYDYWLVKVDASGNKQWEQGFGGTSADQLMNARPTGDGGYLLAGYSFSGANGNKTSANLGDSDYWLVKVDGSGKKQWENTFGGTAADTLNDAQPTGDGGYVLAGYSASGVSGNKTNANFGGKDYWLVKVDGSGTKQWERSFGGTGDDLLFSALPTGGGGYLLAGYSLSGVSGNKTNASFGAQDFWLVKVTIPFAPSTSSVTNGNLSVDNSQGGPMALTLGTVSDGGTNYIEMHDANNLLTAGAGAVQVDAHTIRVPAASVTGALTITGGAGDDHFVLDSTAGCSLPPGGLNIDGGGQATPAGDSLTVKGAYASVLYNANNVGSGKISSDCGTVNFTGLEPVDYTTANLLNLAVNVDPSNQFAGTITTTLSVMPGATNTANTEVGFSGGLELMDFGALTGTFTVTGSGAKADTIVVSGVGANFSGHLAVVAQAADTVMLTNGDIFLGAAKNFDVTAGSVKLGEATVACSTMTIHGGNFLANIGGLTPGAAANQSSQLTVDGDVVLAGNPVLNLTGNYVFQSGQSVTIIANDGVNPVGGTFAGLPEGASLNFNGVPLNITYAGGDGADVILYDTVLNVNHPPSVDFIPDKYVNPGGTVSFTATASDADTGDVLTFSLVNPPPGATITGGGEFSWRPHITETGSTNVVAIRVTDDGRPNLSGTNTFTTFMSAIFPPTIYPLGFTNGAFRIGVQGQPGPDYVLSASSDLVEWTDLVTNAVNSTPFEFTDPDADTSDVRFYRVRFDP